MGNRPRVPAPATRNRVRSSGPAEIHGTAAKARQRMQQQATVATRDHFTVHPFPASRHDSQPAARQPTSATANQAALNQSVVVSP